jgi:glycosyltransferase involved in cell wall biosynthesis
VPGPGPRVAMLHGRADPAHDGVADYTGRLTEALRAAGTEVLDVPVDPGPRGAVAAARTVRAGAPDVVHLQFAPSAFGFSGWPGATLPELLTTVPLVTTVHEYGWWSWAPWVPERLWRPLERSRSLDRETGRLVPRSAAVVTTNAEHEHTLRERFPATEVHRLPIPPNVTVVPGTDRAATRARWSLPDDAEVVAFFGFVHPVKGLRYLVDALARLADEHPRLHLVVVGGFTSLALPADEAAAFRDELTGHVAATGVADRVVITGHLAAPEVSAILAAADLAAFPFTAGATTKSGALLAALDHGLPTIVTRRPDQGDDPELVDGRTVVVAPTVRDADVLVTALRRLLDDPALAKAVGDGGRELLAGRDWGTLAARHRDIYAGLRR